MGNDQIVLPAGEITDCVEKVTRNSKANREKLKFKKQNSIPTALLFSCPLNILFTLIDKVLSREQGIDWREISMKHSVSKCKQINF